MATIPTETSDKEQDAIPTVKQLRMLAHDLYHEKIQKSILPIEGLGKLKRKVLKELQHLETLDADTRYNSSNIHYLSSIWAVIEQEGNTVCSVFKKYKYISEIIENELNPHDPTYKKSELIVDIVCDDGLRWIKVKTSNPYSMQLQFMNAGSSSKGKNIVTMADNFLNASNQHQVYFQPPKIEFVFVEGITSDIAYILKQKSILIKGKEIKDDFLYVDDEYEDDEEEEEIEIKSNDINHQSPNKSEPDSLDETCVNVGVRSMLTMISALSNGDIHKDFFDEIQELLVENDRINGRMDRKVSKPNQIITNHLDFEYFDYASINKTECIKHQINNLDENGYTFGYKSSFKKSATSRRKKFTEKSYEEQKMLLQMYMDEMQSPVLPNIMKCIEDRTLICCETAWNHFMDIVNLSAGPTEWKRCHEIQNKIIIVKDQISSRTQSLTGKSMSNINKCVFGTGDSMKIITLTAIASFVRKAEQQGVKYFVHIHPVRPLTERYQREYEKKRKDDDELIKQEKNNENDGNNIITQSAITVTVDNGYDVVADKGDGDMLIVD